jgi:hypothetical protein
MSHYFSRDRCDSCQQEKACKITTKDNCGVVGRICGACHNAGAAIAARMAAEALVIEKEWLADFDMDRNGKDD